MALVPHQKTRRERNMFTSSDDTAMMKQILATHAPDGRDEFSVKPLLRIVEDIFHRATSAPVPGSITDIVQHQVYTQPVVVRFLHAVFSFAYNYT